MRKIKLYYEFEYKEAKKVMDCIRQLKDVINNTDMNSDAFTIPVDVSNMYTLNELLKLLESETEVYG